MYGYSVIAVSDKVIRKLMNIEHMHITFILRIKDYLVSKVEVVIS